jgi:Arc/MetJ-type ribon-helix-helix transcriptional regulator
MKRLNVILNDDAQAIIERYQKEGKFGTRDEAANEAFKELAKSRGW